MRGWSCCGYYPPCLRASCLSNAQQKSLANLLRSKKQGRTTKNRPAVSLVVRRSAVPRTRSARAVKQQSQQQATKQSLVRVGRIYSRALLYSSKEAIIITEFLRQYFSDAYSKPRSRGKTKPFTVRTSLPSYSTVPCAPGSRGVRTPHRTSICGCHTTAPAVH